MYLEFFSLTEKPFGITPDTRFLYPSPQHEEAIEMLLYGIRERRGFMVLTGEVGTGKTTTIRAALDRIDATTATALVLNPLLSTVELLRAINRDFGISVINAKSIQENIEALNTFLLTSSAQDRNAVVIIDEAQDLSPEALEMLRLLSNLETQTQKLLQLVLVGQPELEEILAQDNLRQLRQRIQLRYALRKLDVGETRKYFLYRIHCAGGSGHLVIEPSALAKIHQISGGVPRLINSLGELILMTAFARSTHVITSKIVAIASHEMMQSHWQSHVSRWAFWKRRGHHVTAS